MRFIAKFSLTRKISVLMLIILIAVLSLILFSSVPLELYPSFKTPYLEVFYYTERPVSPVLLCRDYSMPIEGIILSTKGVKDVSSETSEGSIRFSVGLSQGADAERLKLRLKENLKSFKRDGVLGPFVNEFSDTLNREFLSLYIAGDESVLKGFKREIAHSPEVREVEEMGAPEISLKFIPKPIVGDLGVSVRDIYLALNDEGFELNFGEGRRALEVGIEDLSSRTVILPDGKRFPLLDLVDTITTKEGMDKFYVDGERARLIKVYAREGASKLKLSKEIRNLCERFTTRGLDYRIVYDEGEEIRREYSKVFLTFVFGIVLSFISLFFFFKDAKLNLFVTAIGVISFQLSIILMSIFKISFNVLSISGLVLGFGMLLDNAVVFYEAVVKKLGEIKVREAIEEGAEEIFPALLSSVITTIIVFLPFLFLSLEHRVLFMPFGIALSIGLISSLLVTYVVMPFFLSLVRFRRIEITDHNPLRSIIAFRIPIISFSLFVLILGAFIFTKKINRDILPHFKEERSIYVDMLFPYGIGMEEREYLVDKVHSFIKEGLRGIDGHFITEVYEGGSSIEILFSKRSLRTSDPLKFRKSLVNFLSSFGGTSITVSGLSQEPFNVSPSGDFLFRITLKGYDYDRLLDVSEHVAEGIKGLPYITKVDPSYVWRSLFKGESYTLSYNPEICNLGYLRDKRETYLFARVDTQFKYGEELVKEDDLSKVSGFAKIEKKAHPISIKRSKGFFLNDVGYGFSAPYGLDVIQSVEGFVKGYSYPAGFGYVERGFEEPKSNVQFLIIAGLAVFFIFCILGITFNSLRQSIFVLFSLFYAFCGIVFMYFLFRESYDSNAIVGTILSFGIAVNNAILVAQKGILNLKQGVAEPFLRAASEKMRACLLTTLTTCFAALPFLFYPTGDIWHKFSLCIIGGVSFSTLYTIFVLPLWLEIFEGGKGRKE